MAKSTSPLSDRLDDNEEEVDTLRVSVGKLEERVNMGFNYVSEKLETIDCGLKHVSDQVESLVQADKDKELTNLRKRWGIVTKILGAIVMAILGGLIKGLIAKK